MKTLLASFLVLRSYTAFDLEHYLSRLSVRVDRCGLVEAARTALGEKRYLYFAFLARRNGILRVFRTRAAALRTHILYHKITVACVNELKHTAHRPPVLVYQAEVMAVFSEFDAGLAPLIQLSFNRHSGKSHRKSHQSKYFQCLFHRI